MTAFARKLLTVSDEAFFDLMRNYLGPIRTPFNKHDLISRLEAFLRQEETQERIVSLIDRDDAELLSVIWALGEPTYDELFESYRSKKSFLDLHNHLLNLEDRLLIYRDDDAIRLNPLLRPVLEEQVLGPELAFATEAVERVGGPALEPWVGDTLLLSLYALLREGAELHRADGSLRKRAATDLAGRIPVLLAGDRLKRLLDAMQRLGLTEHDGRVADAAWDGLAELSLLRRRSLVCAAFAAEDESDCQPYAGAVESVLLALNGTRAVTADSAGRLLLALAPPGTDDRAEAMRQAMQECELLQPGRDGYLRPVFPGHVSAAPSAGSAGAAPGLVVHANFEITMQHEIGFGDGLFAARCASLVRHDRYPRFEITKESYARALRGGLAPAEIPARLAAVAGSLPQNVAVSLQSWTAEYESLRLWRGVVLRANEARRHVIDHTPEIRALVREELAPGVYLLHDEAVGRLQQLLALSGIEMIPELTAGEEPPAARRFLGVRIDPARVAHISRVVRGGGAARGTSDALDRAGELLAALEAADLPTDQREEIANRISRKIIVSAGQIREGIVRAEKSEAKGLDYAGKVRVIERAISDGASYLEVIERGPDGSPERHLVEPALLRKAGNDLLLVGNELPERRGVELPVSKLRLVRRLRRSLFSG